MLNPHTFIRELFELFQSAIKLLDHRLNTLAFKGIYKRSVIPKSTFFANVESRPDFFSYLTTYRITAGKLPKPDGGLKNSTTSC